MRRLKRDLLRAVAALALLACSGVATELPAATTTTATTTATTTTAEPLEDCECWWEAHEPGLPQKHCRCSAHIQHGIHPQPHTLTLSIPDMLTLRKDALAPYRSQLTDVVLTEMRQLTTVEVGAFNHMPLLRTIYISEAPALTQLPECLFCDTPAGFRSLRVVRTGLESVPDLTGLSRAAVVHMVDLESNKIGDLQTNSVSVETAQLILNYNSIEAVHGWAFNGSKIAALSLKGNWQLSYLHEDAFSGIHSLADLDLSQTAITQLPTSGLGELHRLRLEEAPHLTTIPSVYSFRHLREAWLTYSFHCCAFKFPARHDPEKHKAYMAMMRNYCGADFDDTGQAGASAATTEGELRWRRDTDHGGDLGEFGEWGDGFQGGDLAGSDERLTEEGGGWWGDLGAAEEAGWGDLADEDAYSWQSEQPQPGFQQLEPLRPAPTPRHGHGQRPHQHEDHGDFSQTTARIPDTRIHALCGNLSRRVAVRCTPEPDALNPCEDIMGLPWLRGCVWVVVTAALLGNAAVLLVLLCSASDLTVPKFLMCHLATADFCMGLYLLALAAMDLKSMGFYFNYAYSWQIGAGCQVAGFLTVFASQLSVYTLSVVTLERWFAITYAIYLNKRLSLRAAAQVMAGGWLYALGVATLPLVGVSNYSSTSICLPMEARRAGDVAYLVVLLAGNGLAFLMVAVCYAQIYASLGRDTRHAAPRSGELTVANKMALLVFTDFACWAPIAFFGLTAVAGYPLIDVTRSKILLVFFYPLNSCANPYLYAILTAQYRRDLVILLARYGLCTRMAQKYKMGYSVPTSNNSNPVPLLPRCAETTVTQATSSGTSSAPATAAAYV
ncbi:probable glycoprotein hormone G-protein coupled receptor isoform X2 [Schistocerca gregaria]|nr:probable glycoprotein hormone G-protein coupled receptor isoform X2 [Schistocerca gregaria]XP_049833252.1 probable glycoprotein hormone G-protein coupled receptor isoform X2 [Schistocerca gregaria]XP_049833253.1 probable glycoprotein hormone G-protein coupled receptor isoform X2 [Schistocerca gregaria]